MGVESKLSYGNGEDQYSYVYDAKNNKLTFQLPDSMHLKIRYTTLANAYADRDTEGSYKASNQFSLSGLSGTNTTAGDSVNATIDKAIFLGASNIGSINIKKYWNNNGVFAVIGSKFKVYKPDQSTLSYTDADEVNPEENYTITNTDGTLHIGNLAYNTIYALVEVEGGHDAASSVPMAVASEPYYFILANKDYTSVTIPAGVRTFASAGILEFENKKATLDTGNITIEKTLGSLPGGLLKDTALNNLKFEITKKGESTPAYTVQGTELTETMNAGKTVYKKKLADVPVGNYQVKEILTSIKGYSVTNAYTVTVAGVKKATGSNSEAEFTVEKNAESLLEFTNTYTINKLPVKISKKAVGAITELAGATLTLYKGSKAPGNTKAEWTWTTGTEKSLNLEAGDYILEETNAPTGYKTAGDIEFTVAADGTITKTSTTGELDAANKTITMRDEPQTGSLTIAKKFAGVFPVGVTNAGFALSKLSFTITRKGDSTPYQTITLGTADLQGGAYTKTITGIPVGTYIVEEKITNIADVVTTASYQINAEAEKTGNQTGDVNVTQGTVSTVTFTNKYSGGTNINISKKAVGGTAELQGAVLKLSEKTAAGNWTDKETWESGTTPKQITVSDGTYMLEEVSAPNGYALSDSITFEVSGGILSGTNTGIDPTVNTVTMQDKPFALRVTKTDLDGTDLAGATIDLYREDQLDTDGKLKAGEIAINSWTSSATSKQYNFGGSLQAGRTYVLIETNAPEGYICATNITFTVNKKEAVQLSASF